MTIHLEIVTPERLAYEDDVDMVLVPGADGELGILPRHTPLVSLLGVGELGSARAARRRASRSPAGSSRSGPTRSS